MMLSKVVQSLVVVMTKWRHVGYNGKLETSIVSQKRHRN